MLCNDCGNCSDSKICGPCWESRKNEVTSSVPNLSVSNAVIAANKGVRPVVNLPMSKLEAQDLRGPLTKEG